MHLSRPTAAVAVAVVALTACGGSPTLPDAAPARALRTVATAYGDVQVPASPQRVLALGGTALDTALAVGVRPVGALAAAGGTGPPAYLSELAADLPVMGSATRPDLAAVAAAGPDLVLTDAGTTREQYDRLAAVAPTVVPATAGRGGWQAQSRVHAAAVGRTPQVESVLAALQQRAAGLRAALASGTTAAVVRWVPEGPVLQSRGLMAGRLLEATGAELPAVAREEPLSLAELAAVDADRLYVLTLDPGGRAALQAARSRLPAVQADRLVEVDGSSWSAAGPVAADSVLDDIEAARS